MMATQTNKPTNNETGKQAAKKKKQQKKIMQQANVYMFKFGNNKTFAKDFIQHRYYESIFISLFWHSF